MRSTFYAAMLFTLLLISSITAPAASSVREEFKVTEVFLKADDGRPSGPCPLRVIFNGYITANGPGTIKYTFTRSDGSTGPVYAMEFKKAGTQAVMTNWTLGDARVLPRYAGWQAVKVLSPVEIESNHETGSFEINCGTGVYQAREMNPKGPGDDKTLSTELVSLMQGQTARLEVANTGDQSLVVWLFFRDNEGKVLIKKEVKIKPGATGALEYSITGPNNPLNIAAQFGSKDNRSLLLIHPTLEIVNKQTRSTVKTFGPEAFTQIWGDLPAGRPAVRNGDRQAQP